MTKRYVVEFSYGQFNIMDTMKGELAQVLHRRDSADIMCEVMNEDWDYMKQFQK